MKIARRNNTQAIEWCADNIAPVAFVLHNAVGSGKWRIDQSNNVSEVTFTDPADASFFALAFTGILK